MISVRCHAKGALVSLHHGTYDLLAFGEVRCDELIQTKSWGWAGFVEEWGFGLFLHQHDLEPHGFL